jgi:hypothetical protein
MILECIKEGFALANKNLQLVFVRIVVTIINLVSFFISLGIPLVFAIIYMGFDLAHAKDLLPFLTENPVEFVSRYMGLVFLVGSSLVFYLTFVSILFLYSLGGTLGVLRASAVNIQYKFSLSSFFKEANRNFVRLFWIILLVSLGSVVLFTSFTISGGIIAAIIQALAGGGGILELFFSSFIMVSVIILSIIFFVACLMFTGYSMVVSVMNGKGAVDCIKKTFDFLKQKPEAFLFYFILFAGSIIANSIFFVLKMPFNMVPVLGPVMNIVLTLFSALFQSYLALVIWSSLIMYYVRGTNYPVYSAEYEI